MAGAKPTLAAMSRPVSARRVLAVMAALLALPWPVAVLGYAVGDDPVVAVIAAIAVAIIVAAPFFARREKFPVLASAVWLLLLFLGFVGGLAGGLLVWPGAFLFLAATAPARETKWRLGWLVGAVALVAAAVGAVFVIDDARDDPDLAVRLRPGASLPAFAERALSDPHVSAVGSGDPVDVELVDGLTPGMREDTVARLRRAPDVVSVRIDD
jgi:hypothetical protein